MIRTECEGPKEKESIIEKDKILNKRIVFMGIEEFKKEIIENKKCFICGAIEKKKGIKDEERKNFNDEHIIPDWMIRRCNLSNKKITLPNGSKLPYTKYKIQCCEECNSKLGRVIEKPISRLFFKGNDELLKEPRRKGVDLNLFRWLCIIFIKVHLKDSTFLGAMDKEDDTFDWEGLYRVWNTGRNYLKEITLEDESLGTLIFLECKNENNNLYDYMDDLTNKTIMIKIGKICLIGVLDDRGKVSIILKNTLKKIKEPLTDLERKEVFYRVNYIRKNLETISSLKSQS